MIPDSWAAHTRIKPKPRPKGAPPLEKDIQKKIQQAMKLQFGVVMIPIDAGGAGMRHGQAQGCGGWSSTPPGFPDLLGVIPGSGRACFVECKRPGNKPTKAQTAFLAIVKAKGAVAYWADSVESALAQFREQVAA